MRRGITRIEVRRNEARAFYKHCEEHGVRVVHECPTVGGKTVFLCEWVYAAQNGRILSGPADQSESKLPDAQPVERKPVEPTTALLDEPEPEAPASAETVEDRDPVVDRIE